MDGSATMEEVDVDLGNPEAVVEQYKKLVCHISWKFQRKVDSSGDQFPFLRSIWGDLESAGMCGLLNAASGYRPEKGPFRNYAWKSIWNAIQDEWNLYKGGLDRTNRKHRPVLCSATAMASDESGERVDLLAALASHTVAPSRAPDRSDHADYLRRRIDHAMDRLPARNREMVRLYYGWGVPERMDFIRIAERFGVSKQNVQQIVRLATKWIAYYLGDLYP